MTNIKLVIISQNQAEHISAMEEKTRAIANRVWVLDRCTDNSEQICTDLGIDYLTTPEHLEGFQAGFARNLGAQGWDGDIIFLDGDRFPVIEFDEQFLSELFTQFDATLFRVEKDIRRISSAGWQKNSNHGRIFNDFYTCGLALSQNAVRAIREFNESDDILDTHFDVAWGEEDRYLGDVCYHLKLSCGYAPVSVMQTTIN